jgi:N-acetylglucosaminyl-diphospho-decaprenol L-rhamnosyltransferase
MTLSLIVISYNTKDLTLACLRSLYEQTDAHAFETIVVDNASSDGSAAAIAAFFPQVRLITLEANIGFAAANNLAVEIALGEWLMLLNPDTVVLDRAVERLVEFAGDHPEADVFGGRTVFADGSLNPASCWRRPTPWSALCLSLGLTRLFPRSKIFARESYGDWERNNVRTVDIVSGCFFLVRRKTWEELGGFDPTFFMYGEETDFCLRAGREGRRLLFCPAATIVHHGGASEAVRAARMVRIFRAKAMIFQRHWRPGIRWFGKWTLDMWAWSRLMCFFMVRLVRPRCAAPCSTWLDIVRRRSEWHDLPQMMPVAATAAKSPATVAQQKIQP